MCHFSEQSERVVIAAAVAFVSLSDEGPKGVES